jgi:1-acyl-sn-glycerol-3-phosphate acyltransferase
MHIPVEREKELEAGRALFRAYHLAKKVNSHLLIFPEGRRHGDGKTHNFHPGFALLAKQLKRPIIPIKTTGLHAIFPKGKFLIDYYASKPTAIIGEPMYIKDNESVRDFAKRIRSWYGL